MKRAFKPGDVVSTFTGDVGIVLSPETLAVVRTGFKEGNRPGHYFAPGCCSNPDYVTQVPVFFEDGTFDVMRSMNIRKRLDLTKEKRAQIQRVIENRG